MRLNGRVMFFENLTGVCEGMPAAGRPYLSELLTHSIAHLTLVISSGSSNVKCLFNDVSL